MPFPRKLLNDFEEVVLDLRPHWLYFLEPIILGVGALAVAVLGVVVASGGLQTALAWGGLIVAVVALAWGAYRFANWYFINFVVTTDRVIYRSGVFTKSGIQIPLERVNNVNFRQGVLERLVGAGDLIIESAGESGTSRFSDVRQPDMVQNTIYQQIEANEARGAHRLGRAISDSIGRSAGPASVADELERLEGLRNRGSITPEEFDREKRKLLGNDLPPPPPV